MSARIPVAAVYDSVPFPAVYIAVTLSVVPQSEWLPLVLLWTLSVPVF